MTWRRTILRLAAALAAALVSECRGTSVTGTDWLVHFSLPDQSSSESPGEFDIRDALLARIDALQASQTGTLATYTFSAEGTAGRILKAISNALDRSAAVRFVADYDIDTNAVYGGTSLGALAARPVNPLILVKATNSSGIMHDKIGVFDYSPSNRWVFAASWNFTTAASYQQWNVAVEMRDPALFSAYAAEMAELLAGHFHYDPAKSHAPDGSRFRPTGSWGDCWVRFAPYPNGNDGGTNAQTDITNLIAQAESEIVFSLNKLTRPLIASQLVAAADRGVAVSGVIPKSDTDPGGDSSEMYSYLTNTASYAGANMVRFLVPFKSATATNRDDGSVNDLVHTKYMVIDPWNSKPVVIHGSANWTWSALVATNQNDENVVVLRHRDIARLFYAQFKRETGAWPDRDDYWCDVRRTGGGLEAGLWMTGTNGFAFQRSAAPTSGWVDVNGSITGFVGHVTPVTTNGADGVMFYRARRK